MLDKRARYVAKRDADPASSIQHPASSSWEPSYAIRDTSRLTQLPAHVLRYWEACRLIHPVRTSRGHRRYRQQDIERILRVKEFFYIKKMRLEGIRRALADEARKKQKSSELPLELAAGSAAEAVLTETKQALKEILQILR